MASWKSAADSASYIKWQILCGKLSILPSLADHAIDILCKELRFEKQLAYLIYQFQGEPSTCPLPILMATTLTVPSDYSS